jgi:hypothetical protein
VEEPEIVIVESGTTWRFDRRFLESNWTCIWGAGCQGILAAPAEALQQGCCSLGAELDLAEAQQLSALTPMIDPDRFQFHGDAASGIFAPGSGDQLGWHTRIVDDACIFLNRPGFPGGAGCALHLEAIAQDESPIDWKPGVCWQLPIQVEWERTGEDTETATVRAWTRADWGEHGTTMAWCCTEEPATDVGTRRVVDSLADELDALVGTPVFIELRRRLNPG